MIARQELTTLQLLPVPAAVHAAVAVAGEQERVRHLPTELPRHVHVADETDHRRTRQIAPGRSEGPGLVYFEDFGLLIDDEPQCASDRENRERLERRVQREAT